MYWLYRGPKRLLSGLLEALVNPSLRDQVSENVILMTAEEVIFVGLHETAVANQHPVARLYVTRVESAIQLPPVHTRKRSRFLPSMDTLARVVLTHIVGADRHDFHLSRRQRVSCRRR